MTATERLPVLPLRELVLFPGATATLRVGRQASLEALAAASASQTRRLALVSQVDRRVDDPVAADVFTIGVQARIARVVDAGSAEGAREVELVVERRLRLAEFDRDPAGYFAMVEGLEQGTLPLTQGRDARRLIISKLNEVNRLVSQRYATVELVSESRFDRFIDRVCQMLYLDTLARQELLEELDLAARARAVALALEVELASHRQEQRRAESRRRAARGHERGTEQREHDDELDELRAEVAEAELPDAARDRVERELRRLERMHDMSAEANILRQWIEHVLQVPWARCTEDRLALDEASSILDSAHHGLNEPKARILEYLAVRSQSPTAGGPVLCLVGPPGVGKTSLARSTAEAMGREFVRVALGGVADEAQIRGHRRTYVGAMPGRIVAALQRANSRNPVLLLDEIDKLDQNRRGDPASALLEVLDPEQNHSFRDHYLELGVDLSEVVFLCTANQESRLPPPLLDRLEVLRLEGYSEDEKVAIARRFLLPKQFREAGFAPGQVHVTQPALIQIVRAYTEEAGVRQLDRALARCARRLTVECLERGGGDHVSTHGRKTLSLARVSRYLGVPKPMRLPQRGGQVPGVTLGLAWSEIGGSVLRVEVAQVAGSGRLHATGSLGAVMRESAELAWGFLRAHADRLGLSDVDFSALDLYYHLPEGAQPKEGPSAGLALALAAWSAFSDRALPLDTAITGELTLTGLVLPIGGLREKLLAAQRQGLVRVIYPERNQAEVVALPRKLTTTLELVPVASYFEALEVLWGDPTSRAVPAPEPVDA